MAEEKGEVNAGAEEGKEEFGVTLRSFQRTAISRAREGNLIMVGPTGIGKTLCAVSALKEVEYPEGKMAWFLTNTRSLAEQQCTCLKRLLPLKVRLCVGRELDLWSYTEWQTVLKENQVIVATAQVLLNLLDKGSNYLSIDRITYLILDECHAAVRGHPYNKIMAKIMSESRGKNMPRIFGMTATPSPHSVKNLNCPVYAIPEEETKSCAALSPLTVENFSDNRRTVIPELERFIKGVYDRAQGLADLNLTRIEGTKATYENHGLWFCLRHIAIILNHAIATYKTLDATADPITLLRQLGLALIERLNWVVEHNGFTLGGKMQKLVSILSASDLKDGRAMVFVQQRAICRCVHDYLCLLSQWKGKCGMVVGQATSAGASLFGLPSHLKTINAFRAGDINLLVTTDVLSEGIDVPECSVVVVFDLIATAQTFAQMRGRARSREGQGFVVMVPDPKEQFRVRMLEDEAKKFLTMTDASDVELDLCDRPLSQQYPEYTYRVPSTGATITLDNAVTFLFSFCQCSKECKSYGLVPEFEDHDHSEEIPTNLHGIIPLYSCTLTLPGVFGLPPITTSCFNRKSTAHSVGAYMALVALHKHGLIDDDLNPVRQEKVLASFSDFKPEVMKLSDSFNIPPPTYKHLGLEPIMQSTGSTSATATHHFLCYRLTEYKRIAIVTRSAFPDLDDMPIKVSEEGATGLDVNDADLKALVSFNSTMSHLAMHGWHSFSENFTSLYLKNTSQATDLERDKGYLLIPLAVDTDDIDWPAIHAAAESSSPLIKTTLWPLPPEVRDRVADCLVITHARDNHRPRMYQLECVSEEKLTVRVKAFEIAEAEAEAEAQELQAKLREEGDMTTVITADDILKKKYRKRKREEDAKSAEEMEKKMKMEEEEKERQQKAKEEGNGEEIEMKTEEEEEEAQEKAKENGEQTGNEEGQDEKAGAKEATGAEQGGEQGKQAKDMEVELALRKVRLVPSYTRQVWSEEGDAEQFLLYARKHIHGIYDFREAMKKPRRDREQDNEQEEDLDQDLDDEEEREERRKKGRRPPKRAVRGLVMVAPQFCSLVAVPAGVMRDCQRLLGPLYKLEAALKLHKLYNYIGLPMKDLNNLRIATSKPDYERLEVLGDSYLKMVMGQYVLQSEPIITKEGLLHMYRSNLVCNKRLLQVAVDRDLPSFINFRKAVTTEPFRHWAPSLAAPSHANLTMFYKTVSDIVEALLGAYLIDGGPQMANRFLRWVGLPSGCSESCANVVDMPPSEDWPLPWSPCHCWSRKGRLQTVMSPESHECPLGQELLRRLTSFEKVLGYTFQKKPLLVQALTHPSYSLSKGIPRWPTSAAYLHLGDYQRLEFFGDALLDYLVVTTLFFKHPDWGPDEITIKLHDVCSNDVFAVWAADAWEVHKYLRQDSIDLMKTLDAFAKRTEEEAKTMAHPKALADIVESVVAAVFLDSGGDIALLSRLFLPRVMAGATRSEKKDTEGAMEEEDATSKEASEKEGGEDDIMARLREAFPGLKELLELMEESGAPNQEE